MASAHPYTWARLDGTKGRRWRAKWTDADGKSDGKRGFDRKGDAEQYARDREAEIRHGITLADLAPTGRMTLQQWSEIWLSGLDVRPSTRAAYGYALKRILPTLGPRPLVSLRPSELKSWRRALAERLAPRTVDFTVAVLAMMLRAAVLDIDGFEKSPLLPQRGHKTEVRLVDPEELLTAEQIDAWSRALPDVAREMPIVAATSGLRQGELLGLQLINVDFLRRRIRVDGRIGQLVTPAGAGLPTYGPPKTAKGARTVPLTAAAAEALARHLARQPAVDGEPIFRNSNGARWRRPTFGQAWHAGRDAAGLPGWVHWHALRDVYATSLIHLNLPPETIATLMGHSSAAELAAYKRFWPQTQDRTRQALDGLWSQRRDASQGQARATGPAAAP